MSTTSAASPAAQPGGRRAVSVFPKEAQLASYETIQSKITAPVPDKRFPSNLVFVQCMRRLLTPALALPRDTAHYQLAQRLAVILEESVPAAQCTAVLSLLHQTCPVAYRLAASPLPGVAATDVPHKVDLRKSTIRAPSTTPLPLFFPALPPTADVPAAAGTGADERTIPGLGMLRGAPKEDPATATDGAEAVTSSAGEGVADTEKLSVSDWCVAARRRIRSHIHRHRASPHHVEV